VALAASLTVSAARSAGGGSSVGGLGQASATSEFDVHIDAAAAQAGVSRELVWAIIEAESGFDQRAVSPAGAAGLMQLMPAAARRFGVTDSLDARQNIFGGTRYLRVLLDTYGGDVSLSAAAYNAGEGAVARYGGIPPYGTTRAYVRRVNALLRVRSSRAPVEDKSANIGAVGRLPWTEPEPCSPLTFLARPCGSGPGSVAPHSPHGLTNLARILISRSPGSR
jgi:soluble lytic murein transglycosylase-like protein